MRSFVVAGLVSSIAGSILFACDDESSTTGGVPDAAGVDVFRPAVDSGPADPGTGSDAAVPADAGSDASDGGLPPHALFANIAQTLVSVDPSTGALTTIGATGRLYMVMAWDDVAKVARVVLDPYSPLGAGAGTPKLGTLNLCTGATTVGPAITIDGTQVRRSEALAQDPTTGTWFVTVGTAGTTATTEFLSEQNGTIDIMTGAVTVHGAHQTAQDDGDGLMFIGGTLRLLDVVTSGSSTLYPLDKTTGAVGTGVGMGSTLLRVAYDKTRDVVFTAVGSGVEGSATARSIGTLNLTTGAITPLGPVVPAGSYPGGHFNSLLSAPRPVCP